MALKIRGDIEDFGAFDDPLFVKMEESFRNSAQSDEIEELRKKLYLDAVLGCNNRAKFEEDSKHLGDYFTYFSIDCNNLKYVNDTFSHEAGDKLLKTVATVGLQVWGDSFYRFGGDEFAVLIPSKQSENISTEQMNQFKALIEAEAKECTEFPISASIGFASSKKGSDLASVTALAEEMMYADKKAYKKLHPEYDVRKAKLTSETLKEAIEQGTFSEAYKEYKKEQGIEEEEKPVKEVILVEEDDDFAEGMIINPEPEKPKITWDITVNDEIYDGVVYNPEPAEEERPKLNEIITTDEDVNGLVSEDDELTYEASQFSKKIQPVLKETTEKAVKHAVKAQNDKLKLEVAEVLDDEVSYRLSKYEKRRRRRDFKEKVGSIVKGIAIILVVLFILGNKQLRLRFALVFQDLGDMFTGLINNEEVSSNKLVYDLFKDLGDDVNDVNTIETTTEGFSIEEID